MISKKKLKKNLLIDNKLADNPNNWDDDEDDDTDSDDENDGKKFRVFFTTNR